MAIFNFTAHEVTADRTKRAIHSPAETPGKSEVLYIDTTNDEFYDLLFKAQTNYQYNELFDHYDNAYSSFTWATVPEAFGGGANLTVRYAAENPFQAKPISGGYWEVRIRFERVQ